MNRIRTFSLAAVFVIIAVIFSVVPAAYAYSGPPLVYDEAALLSADEQAELSAAAEELSDRYACTVSAVIVNSLNGYKTVESFTDDFYDSNDYGYGDTEDGIMFLISLEGRDFHFSTAGEGQYIFTDYGLRKIRENVLPDLKAGDYAGAFRKYLNTCGQFLEYQKMNGRPYDNYQDPNTSHSGNGAQSRGFSAGGAAASLLAGLGLGGLPLRKQKKELETVRAKRDAADYVSGGLKLTRSSDRFINRNVVRVPVPRDNDSHRDGFSGGGGSTIHVSSSGSSHGGLSGKF